MILTAGVRFRGPRQPAARYEVNLTYQALQWLVLRQLLPQIMRVTSHTPTTTVNRPRGR